MNFAFVYLYQDEEDHPFQNSEKVLKRLCAITGLEFRLPKKTKKGEIGFVYEIKRDGDYDIGGMMSELLTDLESQALLGFIEDLDFMVHFGVAIYLPALRSAPPFCLDEMTMGMLGRYKPSFDVDLYVLPPEKNNE